MKKNQKFIAVAQDEKTNRLLNNIADRYEESYRQHLLALYSNRRLLEYYQSRRADDPHSTRGTKYKSGVFARKIVEIPDQICFDFLNSFLAPMYGPQWYRNRKALLHELVRPWWVVNYN